MTEEKTLFKGPSSPVVNLGTFLLCGAVLTTALVASFLVQAPLNLILWCAAGVTLLYAVIRWVAIAFRVYEVTTERLRVTTGIVTRRTEELELYRVKDASLVEPLPMRMFGCGNIVITTNDASTPSVELNCISGARDLREQLRNSIEACRERKRVRLAELE